MRSFQPTGEPLKLTWELVFKKGGHLLGYALLAAALCRATRPRGWRGALAVLGLVLLYALGDELHQSFVPGRSASLVDVGIDMLGGGIGVGAARYINKVQIILAKR
jgi:VanZ family protein